MDQTLKNLIHPRLEGLDVTEAKWADMLQPVLKKYNDTKHATPNMTPHDAKRKYNHIEVWLNTRNKATFARNDPPLKVGDSVRTYMKPHTFRKGYHPSWSKKKFTILLPLKLISI